MAEGVVVPLSSSVERGRRDRSKSFGWGGRYGAVVARSMLGAAVGIPPLLFNGAFGWATVTIAALSLLALAAALATQADEARKGSSLGPAVVAAFALTAWQAWPLPLGWVSRLRPDVYGAAVRAAAALGTAPPRFMPLTLDPGGTRERVLAALSVAATLLAASLVARAGRAWVLRLAALSVALVVAVTLSHLVADASAIYGVYEPVYTSGLLPSPLLNANHLGGFCAFGAVLALGLATSTEHGAARLGFGLLAFAASALVFASLSRGAIGALAAGCLGYALAFGVRGRRGAGRGATIRALSVFAGSVVVLSAVAWVGVETVFAELTKDDLHKLEVARAATGLLFVHPMLGVGRGAFSSAFAPILGSTQRYVHPENLLLQWGIEWGLPFTALLLGATFHAFYGVVRRTHSAARLAGVVAVVALGLQNLFDFGLEMPGEAVVVAAVAGAVVCERRATSRRTRFPDRTLGAFTLAAGVIALPALAPSVTRGGVLEREGRIERALARAEPAAAMDEVRPLVADAIALHPREPSFPLLAGAAAARAGDPSAPRWLNLAMTLAPQWSSPHEVAARWLFTRGHVDQALLELREAETRGAGSAHDLACDFFRALPRPELVARAAPAAPRRRAAFSNALARCLPLDSEIARAIDAELVERSPEWIEPLVRSARRARTAGDPERALALLAPRAHLHRDDVEFVLAYAGALSATGRGAEAVAVLERAQAEGPARRRLFEALVRAHARLGHAEAVEDTLARLRGMAEGSSSALARVCLLEGEAEERMGHWTAAIRAYREADRYDPRAGALERAARVLRRSGNTTQLYQIYSTLCLRNGPSSPACGAASRIESSARRALP